MSFVCYNLLVLLYYVYICVIINEYKVYICIKGIMDYKWFFLNNIFVVY